MPDTLIVYWLMPVCLCLVLACVVALRLRRRSLASQGIPLTLGERRYVFVPVLRPGELSITGDELMLRTALLNANTGEDDALWILNYQNRIPVALCKFNLVFPAWRSVAYPHCIAYFSWRDSQWRHCWGYDTQKSYGDKGCLACRRVE